ncbi:MAG: MaoC family dehydratase [Dehalococcoidia bacterium]|nr:MaoC family dehydratase [Dehalococcoidia bacterium]MDW8120639.1 MaoC family dehydratase [Chloroflexota bacterium]
MRRVADVHMGDTIGPVEYTFTTERVRAFCTLWGQPGESRFTSPQVAQQEGLPGPIVPGIMSMAVLSRLLTDWAEGGSLRSLDVIFRQPVPHHQPLRMVGTVTDVRTENGQGLVEVDVFLERADGERLVTGRAVVALPV